MEAQSTRIKHTGREVPSSLDLQTRLREGLAKGTNRWGHVDRPSPRVTVPGLFLISSSQDGRIWVNP